MPGLALVGTNVKAPKLNQELLASVRAKAQELKLKLQALRPTQHRRRKDLEQQLRKLHERAELHKQTNGRLSQVISILFAIPSYSIYLELCVVLLCFIRFDSIIFDSIRSCSIMFCFVLLCILWRIHATPPHFDLLQ